MLKKIILLVLLLVIIAAVWRWQFLTSNLSSGEKAPDFSIQTIDGRQLGLADFEGNYLLIDFWGSWCGPCRKDNPLLRDLILKYKDAEFKDAGSLEILSIGIERNKDRWLKAINQDKLFWKNHSSTLTDFKEPMALDYDVKSIPAAFLVNPSGEIVMSNLGLNDIDLFLSKKLR